MPYIDMVRVLFDRLFDCFCVRGPLRLVLMIDLVGNRLTPSPVVMGSCWQLRMKIAIRPWLKISINK